MPTRHYRVLTRQEPRAPTINDFNTFNTLNTYFGMNMAKKKQSNPMGLNLNPTRYGKCSGKAKTGEPCKSRTVYMNGLCQPHGGETPADYRKRLEERSQELFERKRSKLERRIKRWQDRHSKVSGPTTPKAGSVQASTSTGSPAAVARSESPRSPASPAADGMEATASSKAQPLQKDGSKPLAASPAPKRKPAGRKQTSSSSSAPEEIPSSRSSPSPNSPQTGLQGRADKDGAAGNTESVAQRSLRQFINTPRGQSTTRTRALESLPSESDRNRFSQLTLQDWLRQKMKEGREEAPLEPRSYPD